MTTSESSNKPIGTVPQPISDADPMVSLRAKLKTADPEVQNYVSALEAENLKYAKKVGSLQANNLSLNNRITGSRFLLNRTRNKKRGQPRR